MIDVPELKLSKGMIVPDRAGNCCWWKVYDAAGNYLGHTLRLAEALDRLRPLTEDDETAVTMYDLATL